MGYLYSCKYPDIPDLFKVFCFLDPVKYMLDVSKIHMVRNSNGSITVDHGPANKFAWKQFTVTEY